MKFRSLTPIVLTGFVSLTISLASSSAVMSEEKNCAADADKELSLPRGFCATIFADKIGHARQLAIASDGTVYVNTWSGIYYGNDTPILEASWSRSRTRGALAMPTWTSASDRPSPRVPKAAPASGSTRIGSTPSSTTTSFATS